MEHHQTIERPPKRHPRLVDNCLVYVYQFLTSILILKQHQIFKISINFTNPQIYLKITKKFTKQPKTYMWDEQRDSLLLET